ncbi:MAG: 4Fe-4S dicluster domain-containing protein [Acidobacteriota bacterium]|jgi:formate dehydrogenase iron-sulfur subunit
MTTKGMLYDSTLCVGCEACVHACQERWGFKQTDSPTQFSDQNFTYLVEKQGHYVRRMCMHCNEPTCASVCPVGAITKTPLGPVIYDGEKCMGCRYCLMACPFGVPAYEWEKPRPRMRKCSMCYDRVSKGGATACSEACPTGATKFGDRDALFEEARKRILAEPDKYRDLVFGERVVGGTSVLFISHADLIGMGFPAGLPLEPLPDLTHRVLSKIPGVVVIGGVFLYGMYWLTQRKNELAREEQQQGKEGAS